MFVVLFQAAFLGSRIGTHLTLEWPQIQVDQKMLFDVPKKLETNITIRPRTKYLVLLVVLVKMKCPVS